MRAYMKGNPAPEVVETQTIALYSPFDYLSTGVTQGLGQEIADLHSRVMLIDPTPQSILAKRLLDEKGIVACRKLTEDSFLLNRLNERLSILAGNVESYTRLEKLLHTKASERNQYVFVNVPGYSPFINEDRWHPYLSLAKSIILVLPFMMGDDGAVHAQKIIESLTEKGFEIIGVVMNARNEYITKPVAEQKRELFNRYFDHLAFKTLVHDFLTESYDHVKPEFIRLSTEVLMRLGGDL